MKIKLRRSAMLSLRSYGACHVKTRAQRSLMTPPRSQLRKISLTYEKLRTKMAAGRFQVKGQGYGEDELTAPDRRGVRNPPGLMAARRVDGARSARSAHRDKTHRLHHRTETHADHDGQGAGAPRRAAARPRLRGATGAGADPATTGQRPA